MNIIFFSQKSSRYVGPCLSFVSAALHSRYVSIVLEECSDRSRSIFDMLRPCFRLCLTQNHVDLFVVGRELTVCTTLKVETLNSLSTWDAKIFLIH